MNELHLFAGAGGGILGGMLLGHTCVCAVEINPYRRKVLLQRQRDGILPRFPIWDDVTTFDGRPWRGIADVVCGGFPCQDISAAGKGAGIRGERSGLWAEYARIIGEVQPTYVFVENSPILTLRGLDIVLGDLATLGYDAQWGVIGAIHAGAPHRRLRIWIVAHPRHGSRRHERPVKDGSECTRERPTCTDQTSGSSEQPSIMAYASGRENNERNGRNLVHPPERWQGINSSVVACGDDVADADQINDDGGRPNSSAISQFYEAALLRGEIISHADNPGRQEQRVTIADGAEYETAECRGWWESEPDVGRVAHGVASRVDRLEALGDGQVPAVVKLAWMTLMEET